MRENNSNHPAGTIGVIVGPLTRYLAIFTSLERLVVPKGTTLVFSQGVDIARNCNKLVESMTGDWLWMMGDDHRFYPDMLIKLLDRKTEIVAPLVCKRGAPFSPVCHKTAVVGGAQNQVYTWDLLSSEYPNGGMIPVDATGSAGLLVRRWVFEDMPKPWFGYTQHTSEDIAFCLNAKQSGYHTYVDLDQHLSHLTTCDLEPHCINGKWCVKAVIDNTSVQVTP